MPSGLIRSEMGGSVISLDQVSVQDCLCCGAHPLPRFGRVHGDTDVAPTVAPKSSKTDGLQGLMIISKY